MPEKNQFIKKSMIRYLALFIFVFGINANAQKIKLYQLYFDASLVKNLKRPNPSIVMNYKVSNEVLVLDGWLYDKKGMKPVNNVPTNPPGNTAIPLIACSANTTIPPAYEEANVNFALLNISNKILKQIITTIKSKKALTVVLTPTYTNGQITWKVEVSTEAAPPFIHLYDVPEALELASTFNPSPPKELAQ